MRKKQAGYHGGTRKEYHESSSGFLFHHQSWLVPLLAAVHPPNFRAFGKKNNNNPAHILYTLVAVSSGAVGTGMTERMGKQVSRSVSPDGSELSNDISSTGLRTTAPGHHLWPVNCRYPQTEVSSIFNDISRYPRIF
jgi:hypothetical protein